MKNILKTLLLVVAFSFLATGCAPKSEMVSLPEGVKKPDEMKIAYLPEENVYLFRSRYIRGRENIIRTVARYLDIAKDVGLSNGYRYMAIVNYNVNNLTGFPLNKKKELLRYLRLSTRSDSHFRSKGTGKKSTALISRGVIGMRVMYFKEPIPGIFLWDLKHM